MNLFDSREADFFCNNLFLNHPYLHSWKAVIHYCGDVHVDHLIVNTCQPLLTSRFNYSSFMSISSLSSSQSQVIRYSTCPGNKDAILPCLIPLYVSLDKINEVTWYHYSFYRDASASISCKIPVLDGISKFLI